MYNDKFTAISNHSQIHDYKISKTVLCLTIFTIKWLLQIPIPPHMT